MARGVAVLGDVLIVSLATTPGWRANEEELTASLERQGVPTRVRRLRLGRWTRPLRRSSPLGDLVEATAAHGALRAALREDRPRAVIFMSTTSSLLAPVGRLEREGIRVAVRLDLPAAANRPGPRGAVLRRMERRSLGAATMVLATGERSAGRVRELARDAIAVPVTIRSVAAGGSWTPPVSDTPLALAYAHDPDKKGLDVLARAWAELGEHRGNAQLAVTGLGAAEGRSFLRRRGVSEPPGIKWIGPLERDRYLELLSSGAAFVSASRLEEHGIAQLEALVAGVPLVTAPSPGAYEAEPLARRLAPELVVDSSEPSVLARAIAAALAMPEDRRRDYAAGAAELTQALGPDAVDAVVRERVLPKLLA